MPKDRKNCIVVGAGLAGLAAAYRLIKSGWNVDVVEAADRPGGRIHSFRFEDAPDLVCELGAEWIGEDHGAMLALCREFELPTKAHQFSISFWNGAQHRSQVFRPSGWCFDPKLQRRFNHFSQKIFAKLSERQKHRLDMIDWWSFLEHPRMGFTQRDLVRRDLMDSTDFGESIRLTSAYSAAAEYCVDDRKSKSDQMDRKIVGGNERLIDALAAAVSMEGEIHVGKRVTKISHRGSGIEVHVEGRRGPYKGICCVCTVPAHALLKIEWFPDFARQRKDMARQLQYSRIMKTAVLYARRFWEPSKLSRELGFSVFTGRASDFCFDSTHGQPGKKGILCSYAIGDKSDDLAGEFNKNNLMRWITEDVAAATSPRTDIMIAPIDLEYKAWQREAWIGGAYAFYRPGQWFTVRPVLARPHHHVYFAGEHLSDEWQGFMEGAVETGQRAAARVLRRFGAVSKRAA